VSPTPGDPDWAGEAERLRAGLLRLKGALHDRVTGLFSWHLYMDQLISHADHGRLGVLALEFPTLPSIEASRGFELSDRILREAAEALLACRGGDLPEGALVALDGAHGDSFLVFVPEPADAPAHGARLADLAARLGAALERRMAALNGDRPPRLECAVGQALVSPAPAARFERRLHQAIREARGLGRRGAERRHDVHGAEARAILEAGALTTHFQPIVDMEHGTIMGYEALTRGPAKSPLEGPDALFTTCQEARLQSELDRLCRCTAVRNARGIDRSQKLFLNSLPESLGAPGFADGGFREALSEAALEPRHLVLEITERTSIDDFEAFGRGLEPLRRQGFLLAIDDVGTGYSSLQTLTEVQPEFIKVDLSLVKNIHRSLIKQELVHSLLQVGARIGAQVIAEGIEVEEEARALRRCGVRYGQGYLFARPGPGFPGLAPRPE
jgi:EAL domain-containing protein (putative c-di-GMP-specific phosphodiesterase class I)